MQALGKICTACGVERRKRGAIKYDPVTFLPYCEHPYICNDAHPNSPENMVARAMELGKEKAELQLLSFEDASEKFNMQLILNHPDKDRAEKIRKMTNQPFTVRIGTPDRAEFLLDLQDEMGFSSVTEAVRYCIDLMKDARGGYYQEHKRIEAERKHEEAIQNAIEGVDAPEPETDRNEPEQTVDSKEGEVDLSF